MKSMQRSYDRMILQAVKKISAESRFPQTASYVQHGNISVREHCIAVAVLSLKIAHRMPVRIRYSALIRGALLHDYFLYDWHDADSHPRLHGFHHPGSALKNAREDFDLSPLEENIILRHMFPLTLVPPACREAWIVCLADKICASREVLGGFCQKKTGSGKMAADIKADKTEKRGYGHE